MSPNHSANFQTTQWSLVLSAGQGAAESAQSALAALCARYWPPLYSFARRGADAEEAKDLTQAFFARLLKKNLLAGACPQRGRFRSFLLTSFQHFMINQWKKDTAQKRGGEASPLPMDFVSAEQRYQFEPVDHLTPERLFERQWTLTLLEHVLARLRAEQHGSGKQRQFQLLKPFLTEPPAPGDYEALAEELGTSPGAVRVAVHRLRRRYRKMLHEEIAQTLNDERDVENEINRLLRSLSDSA